MREKKFWITEHREHDILRYSVGSDQKDATGYDYNDAHAILCFRNPTYKKINCAKGKTYAAIFLDAAIEHSKIYNDWLTYASRRW